ncbi:hypothetical protein YIM_37315 [Amycolatopsis sp. YIM 10]|nr:hypothetical protein YIM_37315 [Amycolatopsis sp. YIM 10]
MPSCPGPARTLIARQRGRGPGSALVRDLVLIPAIA